jgi:hypothetical protein
MSRPRLVPLVCALGLGLVACGGTDEGRPTGQASSSEAPNPCDVDDGYEFQNLMDFDPPEGEMPALTEVRGCDPALPLPCFPNFNFDSVNTPGQSDTTGECPDVPVFTNPPKTEVFEGYDAGVRCGRSEYATRLTMTNLAVCTNDQGRQGWGGSMSLTFADSADDPRLDASEWDGVSFWVKKASSATRSAFIAAAADPYTAGFENIEDPFGQDRSCDGSGAVYDENEMLIPDTEKCDGFGVAVTLADDWTFIPVRFAAMRQKGFGMRSHVGHLVTEEITRLQFLISAGDWDIWIDDIAFFKEPDP